MQCLCGCENETKKNRKYLKGHNLKVVNLSIEQRQKISASLKGIKKSTFKNKVLPLCACGCKQTVSRKDNKYVLNHHPTYWTGKHLPDEVKKKLSDSLSGEKNPFYGRKHSDESKEKISKANKGKLAGEKNPFYKKIHSDETKQLIGKQCKERWQDDLFRNNLIDKLSKAQMGRIHSDESKEKMSESQKKIWDDPEKCTEQSLLSKNLWQNDIYRKKVTDAVTKSWIDADERRKETGNRFREKSPWCKGLTKETNEVLARRTEKMQGENHPMFGKHHSDETKKHLSEIRQGTNIGEVNPNWQGGISREPYCFEFDSWLKDQIKERDDFGCQNPYCNNESNKLVVHHIDYNKKYCSANNLITLCNDCHGRSNFNRPVWEWFYSSIVNYRFSITNNVGLYF